MKKSLKFISKFLIPEKKKYVATLLLIFAVAGIIQWVFLRNWIGECMVYFLLGAIAGKIEKTAIRKKYRNKFIIFAFTIMFLIFVIATIFDPILKPVLDRVFWANTVATFKKSLIANGSVFLSFVVGYYSVKKEKISANVKNRSSSCTGEFS